MPFLEFVGLLKKRIWPARSTKRNRRPLSFLRLEDRQMLAGILGTAQDFAVLAHTTVTNTGPTVIYGSADTQSNVGVFNLGNAGDASTGFSTVANTFVGPGTNTNGPGLVNAPAAIHLGDSVANQALTDLSTAYTTLSNYGTATNLTGHDLGTSGTLPIDSLVAGVYSFDTTAQLNGVLELDAQGTNGGVWIFQIGTSFTTASASAVQLINPGDNLGADIGVYWVVGSSATIGTFTAFEGNILANQSITLNTGATIYNGRALAVNGAVTLDTNIISNICPPASSSPNDGPGFSLGGFGSIAWEKRDGSGVLLAGAQFTINTDPTDGVGILTILDNGPGDANPAAGQFLVNNALLGTYTVTETVAPLGYMIDADPTRVVSVTVAELNPVIGVQGTNDPGVTDESDFHNSLIPAAVGSIAWEKRDGSGVLLAGAQFTINTDPTDGVGILTILDNGPGDANPATGQFLVNNALLGTYTVTETVAPLGYMIDADPTRIVSVTLAELNPVIGVQGTNDPGVTDESDFHNSLIPAPVGSIAWENRDSNGVLLARAQFTINTDPTDGVGILTILDNGPGDANPAAGQFLVNNALLGTYTITQTVAPVGYRIDTDSTRIVSVTLAELNPVIGVQGINNPGVTDESDFHDIRQNAIVIGAAKSPMTPQMVTVLEAETGAVLTQFAPYGNNFQGGVRVATGDLTGDGIDEIVTAPGWSITGEVRVYTQNGTLLTSFLPYGSTYNGGIQVAVADVNGDGLNDFITVPSYGAAVVKVFQTVLVAGLPTFNASLPYRNFLAFPASFIGGSVVAAADMGMFVGSSFVNTLDGKSEIVVGSGAGIQTTVKVFDVSGTPTAVRSFTPFSTNTFIDRGGVSLSVARINADPIADIVVGAGVNGGSLVDVWAWSNNPSATLSSLSTNGLGFAAFTGPSRRAPVQVATQDTNDDGIADSILAAQGPGGTTGEIRAFNITSTAPLQVAPATVIPGSFPSPYFIAAIAERPAPPQVAQARAIPSSFSSPSVIAASASVQIPSITVQILNGVMIITGTEQDDTIKIASGVQGGLIVTANKPINGLASPQTFVGATSFVANTRGGNDDLWLAAPLTLNSVTVDLGNGNDRLALGADPNNPINNNVLNPLFGTLGSLAVNGPLLVTGGEGNDQVIERSTVVNGVKTINLGEGNNEYNVYKSSSNETNFSSGAGSDKIDISYLTSRQPSQFNTGAGNDLISTYNSRFSKAVSFNSGAGADTVTLDVNIYDEAMMVDTGSEADYLLLARSTAYKSVSLTTGDGADTVLIGKYISGRNSSGGPVYSNGGSNIDQLTLNTNAGTDSVQIANNAIRLFYANLGDAYDDAELADNIFTDGLLDGGGQGMRRRLTGNVNLRTRNAG